MLQTPKLGQDVHYHDHQGRIFAAKITKVHGPDCVNLVAFDDGTLALGGAVVAYSSVMQEFCPGGWTFPPEDAPVEIESEAPSAFHPDIVIKTSMEEPK